jgi:hypothetical protein
MLSISVLIVNLIFTGIPHSDGHKENTDVLHNFWNSELEISDANGIPFQSVHRLGTRPWLCVFVFGVLLILV